VLRFAVYNNDASTTFADNKEAQVQITSELKYSPPAIQGNDTRSTACDISTFKIGDVVGTISDTNISVSVPFGTNVTNVTPVVTVSAGATFTPSGAVDFTNPVIFTVTSEDKLTTKTFTVTIIVQSATSSSSSSVSSNSSNSSSSSTPTSSTSSVTSTASSTSTDNTVTPPNTGDSIPAAAVLMLLIGAAGVVVCKKKK
jgi:LPXTG-motif cell wall-anchored protein